jgi:DNA-directed RNA polymerase subunit RPC12/RpoP
MKKQNKSVEQISKDKAYTLIMTRKNHDWNIMKNGKYAIEKTIQRMNQQEIKLITETEPTALPTPKMSKIYVYRMKEWKHLGYRCMECDKTFSDEIVIQKHTNTCQRINKRQTEDDEDYLQFVPRREL